MENWSHLASCHHNFFKPFNIKTTTKLITETFLSLLIPVPEHLVYLFLCRSPLFLPRWEGTTYTLITRVFLFLFSTFERVIRNIDSLKNRPCFYPVGKALHTHLLQGGFFCFLLLRESLLSIDYLTNRGHYIHTYSLIAREVFFNF